ncbi:hypothetical protein [Phormidium nigroviride]
MNTKVEEWNEELEMLPVVTDDEMDIVAGLAMEKLYEVFQDRGGRQLMVCQRWAAVAGYRIPPEKESEFRKICEAKWRLIIQYLETEYRHR